MKNPNSPNLQQAVMQIGKWPHLRILGSGPTFIGRVLTFVCPKSPKIAFSARGGILSGRKKLSFPPNGALPAHGAPLDIKAEARVPNVGLRLVLCDNQKNSG